MATIDEGFIDEPVLHLSTSDPITVDTFKGAIGAFNPDTWPLYRKHSLTRAIRVAGAFAVQIDGQGPESVVTCDNGYVAVDARGYPYPISADEFPSIYGPADEQVKAPTFFELVAEALGIANASRDAHRIPGTRIEPHDVECIREFAIAIHALEDAQMRYTRGRSRELGVFRPVDLDSVDAIADRRSFLDDAEAARE